MPKRKSCKMPVVARHQLRVARETLRMPAAMANVMGQTRAEAKRVVARLTKQYGAACTKKRKR